MKKIVIFCCAMGLGLSAVAGTNAVPSTVKTLPPTRVQSQPVKPRESTKAVPAGNDVYYGPAFQRSVLRAAAEMRDHNGMIVRGAPGEKSTDEKLQSIFRTEGDQVTDSHVGSAVQILFPTGR